MYVVRRDFGFLVNRSLLRKDGDVGSERVLREVCGLVLGRGSRGRRLGTRELCCLGSLVASVWRGGVGRSGRLLRGNANETWRRRRGRGGDFDCCGKSGCSRGDVCLGEGDVLLRCSLVQLV